MSSCANPASARDALEMIRSGYGYLAAADPTAMATAAQASCLLALEDLVRLCGSLDHLDHLHHPQGPCDRLASPPVPGQPGPCQPGPGQPMPATGSVPAGLLSRRALQQAIIGKTLIFLQHSKL